MYSRTQLKKFKSGFCALDAFSPTLPRKSLTVSKKSLQDTKKSSRSKQVTSNQSRNCLTLSQRSETNLWTWSSRFLRYRSNSVSCVSTNMRSTRKTKLVSMLLLTTGQLSPMLLKDATLNSSHTKQPSPKLHRKRHKTSRKPLKRHMKNINLKDLDIAQSV